MCTSFTSTSLLIKINGQTTLIVYPLCYGIPIKMLIVVVIAESVVVRRPVVVLAAAFPLATVAVVAGNLQGIDFVDIATVAPAV